LEVIVLIVLLLVPFVTLIIILQNQIFLFVL